MCGTCTNYSLGVIKNNFDDLFKLMNEINERAAKNELEFNEFKRDIKKSIDNISDKLNDSTKERDNSKSKKSNDNMTANCVSTKNTLQKNAVKTTTARRLSITRTLPTSRALGTPTTSRITAPTVKSATTKQQSAKIRAKKNDETNVNKNVVQMRQRIYITKLLSSRNKTRRLKKHWPI